MVLPVRVFTKICIFSAWKPKRIKLKSKSLSELTAYQIYFGQLSYPPLSVIIIFSAFGTFWGQRRVSKHLELRLSSVCDPWIPLSCTSGTPPGGKEGFFSFVFERITRQVTTTLMRSTDVQFLTSFANAIWMGKEPGSGTRNRKSNSLISGHFALPQLFLFAVFLRNTELSWTEPPLCCVASPKFWANCKWPTWTMCFHWKSFNSENPQLTAIQQTPNSCQEGYSLLWRDVQCISVVLATINQIFYRYFFADFTAVPPLRRHLGKGRASVLPTK